MGRKNILLATFISFFILIFEIGCSLSDTDSSTVSIPSIQVNITQQANYSFESNEIKENPVLMIKWTTKLSNIDKIRVQETNSGYDKEIDYSKYSALSVEAKYDTSYRIIVTPKFSDKYGSSVENLYTTDKNKNIDVPNGKELFNEIQEIDCSMESGEYKVLDLEKNKVRLLNANDTSVYVARLNTNDSTLYSNRFVLPESANSSNSLKSVLMNADFSLPDETGDSGYAGQIYFNSEDCLDSGSLSSENENFDLFEIQTEDGAEIINRICPNIKVDDSTVVYPSRNSRSADSELNYPLNFNIGDVRTVYAGMLSSDIDHNMAETTASLQYKSDKCYVWVVERYFVSDGSSRGAQINGDTCEKIGRTLDEVLGLERNIFGNEYEMVNKFGVWVPMESNSETGTMVNILLYDIAGDYVENNTSGIYGFFTSGDYYIKGTKYNTSSSQDTIPRANGGKYLHLDSGFAANEKTLPTLISTVAHEFQHMINYGQKKQYENAGSTFLNEMCSMLAEDMFQEKFQVSDMDSGGKYRFMHLIFSWRYLPIFNWNSDQSCYSYSNGFGLGSFLSKKYGGADFVYDFMHVENDNSCSLNSLMEAVNKHDSEATIETVLRDFCVELCTCKTYNTDVYSEKHVMNDYKYPMTKFDFKNYNFISGGTVYKGPQYTKITGDLESFDKYKIDVSKVEDVSSDSEDLYFFGKSSEGLKEYIVIVKN